MAIRSYTKSFFKDDDNVRIGIGRAGNVIGGGDWALDRIVPDSVMSWTKNEVVMLRNPDSTRPWQHVLEPLSGYITLAMHLNENKSLHGEAFNFGPPSNQNYTVEKLVKEMTKYWCSAQYEIISKPNKAPLESGLLKLNCDKALHFLNWKAIWDFEKTIKYVSPILELFIGNNLLISNNNKLLCDSFNCFWNLLKFKKLWKILI